MKPVLKIFAAIAFSGILYGCGKKHDEQDRHGHGAEEPMARRPEAVTVTSLTSEQMDAVGITLGPVENRNLTEVIKANGILRVPNNNRANATSLYGGVVKSLSVQLGDYVRKGQVIATIVNPQFIQLQEEYLALASQMTLAGQELQRQQELNEGNAGAKKNLQTATAAISSLQVRRASLYQQIQMMGIDPDALSDTGLKSALIVMSPINGTVSNVFSRIGSYVDVSSPVAEIVDNSLLHLDLQVFEKDLPRIRVGQEINFTVTNNPSVSYTAKVFTIGASFENESKTIAIHSSVTGNKNGLIDGMNITGIVSLKNVTAPAVPTGAIVEADGKYYIFVETDKEEEEPGHDEHHGHDHAHTENDGHGHDHHHEDDGHREGKINFEKIEVAKGVSDLGYTAIYPVAVIPAGARVVTKGAFFINAKMSSPAGHAH
ncbi:MAG: efflux transporter periplasmic adaptor subunit [Cytophagaceae bacterium SCN 52-12]|nr:MAG: efflux transporter periplasmic adaptor subunit [Cytophagaceae bacterium SCN 52-12]